MTDNRAQWDKKIHSLTIEPDTGHSKIILVHTKLKDISPELQKLKELYKDMEIPEIKPRQFYDKKYSFTKDHLTENVS